MAARCRAAAAAVFRVAVFLAGVVGVLGLVGEVARQYAPQQHCEPLQQLGVVAVRPGRD